MLVVVGIVACLAALPAGAWETDRPLGGLGGKVLVADPRVSGGFFAETVILICQHDATGAFGLVLNRRSRHADTAERKRSLPWPLHVGGPVNPWSLFLLLKAEDAPQGAVMVEGGFAVANPQPYLAEEGGAHPSLGVLLMGYSGWAPGQLEAEMARGGWIAVDADEDLVFGAQDEAKWRRALGKRGVNL